MNEGELFDRIVSAHSGVNLSDLTSGAFTQQKMDAISKSSIALLDKQILIRDESIITPAQFSAAAREMVTVNKVELIVFDYLQLVTPADPKANREQQVAHASRVFKTTAAELGIPSSSSHSSTRKDARGNPERSSKTPICLLSSRNSP